MSTRINFADSALSVSNGLASCEFKMDGRFALASFKDMRSRRVMASQRRHLLSFDRNVIDLSRKGSLKASLLETASTEDAYQGAGMKAIVGLEIPCPCGSTLSIRREISMYDGAPAVRIVDFYSSGKPLAGLLYSELLDVKLKGAPGESRVMDYFSCSDQSNWRLVEGKAADGKHKGFMLISGGLFLYKEGPVPDCQPVKSEYDFLLGEGGGDVSLVGLGFDKLRPGELRRANGVVLGILEDPETMLGFKLYQSARYKGGADSVEFLANSWPAFHLNVTEEKMSKELDLAGSAGIKTVFIDDGWFSTFMGEIDQAKFPNKFSKLSAKAREKGIELGLWMDPWGLDGRDPNAKVWDGSECHDSNTEGNKWNWIARSSDFIPVEAIFSENTRVYYGMDMMNPGYYAHIRDKIVAMWKDYGIRRFKFDLYQMSRYDTLLGDGHQHMEAYRGLLAELKSLIPGLTISSDVTRRNRPNFDFGMDFGRLFMENRGRRLKDHRFYQPYISLRNLWQKSKCVPTRKLELEVRPQETEYSVEYTLSTALFANPLYWGSIAEMSPERIAATKEFMDRTKGFRDAVAEGFTVPFGEVPDKGSWSGMASLAKGFPKDCRGRLAVYRNGASSAVWKTPLPGLRGRCLKLTDALSGATFEACGDSAEFSIPESFGFQLLSFEQI